MNLEQLDELKELLDYHYRRAKKEVLEAEEEGLTRGLSFWRGVVSEVEAICIDLGIELD